MSSAPPVGPTTSLYQAFRVQLRVIGALIMRELHTRYGRENIGYLWLIAEPLMFGSVIALLHSGQKSSEGDMDPVALTVIGYSLFIVFRGIVNRSDGALTSNLPLLYHRMVTVLDIVVARAVLELAGTLSAFLILLGVIMSLGYATEPVRPLMLLAGIGYIFWIALALSMIITAASYDKPVLERLIHPFTYFMIPLSGAFYRIEWIPQPYRDALLWIPMPHMFELARYGQFADATLEFVDFEYITGACMVLTLVGLLLLSLVRRRVHLS